MPSSCPIVMMPVPPTPATTMPQASSAAGSVGCGGSATLASDACRAGSLAGFFSSAPSTLTKLGQKPFRQASSWLQASWLMRRLRPNSVSTGSTARQLLCTEQSPQPSHTSSLMTRVRLAAGIVPRFLRRRFSVAQVWS